MNDLDKPRPIGLASSHKRGSRKRLFRNTEKTDEDQFGQVGRD